MSAYLVFLLLVGIDLPSGSPKAEDLFVLGNAQFTLCHEIGHALVEELNIPLLGGEEDAVDRLATICFLHPEAIEEHDPIAVAKLMAVAEAWRLEWELTKGAGPIPFWDSHLLDIQRFYTIACLIYGSDPQRFSDLPDKMSLRWERAWSCEEHEYARAVEAAHWILETYGAQAKHADGATEQVKVEYEQPATADSKRALQLIRAANLFESKATLLSRLFHLPRELTIVGANCLGDAAAYWRSDRGEIVVCYELLERFVALANIRGCLGREENREGCPSNDQLD